MTSSSSGDKRQEARRHGRDHLRLLLLKGGARGGVHLERRRFVHEARFVALRDDPVDVPDDERLDRLLGRPLRQDARREVLEEPAKGPLEERHREIRQAPEEVVDARRARAGRLADLFDTRVDDAPLCEARERSVEERLAPILSVSPVGHRPHNCRGRRSRKR
jgi:hypothetical protein